MSASPRRCVVMIGTALGGRGGMSSVAAAYSAAGLFARVPVCYIEAHREVSVLGKLWLVVSGLAQLFGMLISGKVALLHVHAASGISFWRKRLFIRLGKIFSRPVVVHLHGGEFLEFYRSCSARQQTLVRRTLESADRVIVLSSTWRDRLGEISDRLHTVVLPNPVAVPIDAAVRDGKEFRILFLGRLERAKGVFELIEAFALLRHIYPTAVLSLGGEGDFSAINQRISELDIKAWVELPGWVVGDEKEALLRTADAFALPSHVEGLPVSMLEAMAYGVPVVVSRVGSVPGVVIDGEQGLLISVEDVQGIVAALSKLAASPKERQRLGMAGRDLVVSTFAADRVCAQLEEIYAAVLSGEGKPC